jgi:hypothetical protein
MDNDLTIVIVNGQQVSDAIPEIEAHELAHMMADDLTEQGKECYIEMVNVSKVMRDWARETAYLN